jgi:hypothetical protein
MKRLFHHPTLPAGTVFAGRSSLVRRLASSRRRAANRVAHARDGSTDALGPHAFVGDNRVPRSAREIPRFFARSLAFLGGGVEHFPRPYFSFVAVGGPT